HEVGDNRFQIVRATPADVTQLTDDHVWVIYLEDTWPSAISPQQVATARGYRIGPTFASGPPGRRYILFLALRTPESGTLTRDQLPASDLALQA
ncbi:MAG: hypothetical protein ABJB97_10390, partial [Acidobacteriota bacterium]